MPREYERDVYDFEKVMTGSIIAKQLFDDLKQRISKDITLDDVCDRYKVTHCLYISKDITLGDVCDALKGLLKKSPFFPKDFLELYFDQFFYETVFKAYNAANISLRNEQEKTFFISDYLRELDIDINDFKGQQEKISRVNKLIKRDLTDLKYEATINGKLTTFYYYMNLPLDLEAEAIKNAKPILNEINTIFNLKFYNKIMFCSKCYQRGKNIKDIFQLMDDYFKIHDECNETEFALEHSAYQLELVHRFIQFQKCVSSYVAMEFPDKKIQEKYVPLYMYIRLFDTPYLSLTDYILKEYPIDYEMLYENEEAFYILFNEMQLLNNYWFPILTGIVQEVLFLVCEGDFEGIMEKCLNYYNGPAAHNKDLFQKSARDSKEKLKGLKYPDPKNYNNWIGIDDKQILKSDNPLYRFNYFFTKCFYTKEFPNYIMQWLTQQNFSISIEGCHHYIDISYRFWKINYSDVTLKTSGEFNNRDL